MSTLGLILIACFSGIAVALQGEAMGGMNRAVGTPTTMIVTYGSGAILSLLILLAARPAGAVRASIPWYGWSAGLLGLVIVGGIGYAAPRLGLTRTLVVTVAAQLAAALLIEQAGLFGNVSRPISPGKAIGTLLTVVGVWLVVR